jgi:hypothetical protein
MPVVVHRYATHIRTPESALYAVTAVADEDVDSNFVGWLEFAPVNADLPALLTDVETTQAWLEAMEVWADGLEPTYLQGAFERAHLRRPSGADL